MVKIQKKAAKKSVAKKAAKKPAKKSVAKKVAKKPAKKPTKKSVKKPIAKQAAKKPIKRVSLRIARKMPVAPVSEEVAAVDTAKSIAFAMSIAKMMKKSAAIEDRRRDEAEIRLSRRPTTRANGRATEKFPAADLRDFRKRLLEARARALSGADILKDTGFNRSEDHEADGGDGTNQTLRLQALGQMGVINRTIQQIDEALHRIDDGTYGVCTVCGQLIRKPRLINQPFVLTCMECQNDMEKTRG